MPKTIVWFRQDLRLQDNPALIKAAARGQIIPIYIWDPSQTRKIGAASKWWLHHSLQALSKSFSDINISLILRSGHPEQVLTDLVQETGADGLFWNRCYEPDLIARDQKIKSHFKDQGLQVESFNGSLCIEPWEVLNGQGLPYKVYSPFWRAALQKIHFPNQDKTSELIGHDGKLESDQLEDWQFLPKINWDKDFYEHWQPGEEGAWQKFEAFLENGLSQYKAGRDFPDLKATSFLSPHLHFGEISLPMIWRRLDMLSDIKPELQTNIAKFKSELGWREFNHHLIYHFPETVDQPFRGAFEAFPWGEDDSHLTAWQQGMTGYPFVDAGMRELWHTGTMHNRVRMVVASFLTKHLLIHWKEGEKWFWDTLLDADLANNIAGWQWAAGSGADAAPYFRIFNPTAQGQKFDPDGAYIRRWVPELKNLPTKYLYEPSVAPKSILEEAGIKMGTDYPMPIVDHKMARERALSAYQQIKK